MCEISIIIPVYNGEKTIKRCVDSILNQTFKDLEIILVDDGSKDSSLDICNSLADENKKIKVFSQSNCGSSVARNLGIEKSNGKYIMFCDCDDTVSSEWCKNLYNKIEQNKNSMPYCGFIITDEFSIEVSKVKNNNLNKQIDMDDFFYIDEMGLSGFVWNKIFSKEVIIKNNIKFDKNIRFNEDLKFVLEYIVYIDKIIYTDSEDYYYHSFEDSLSKNYNEKEFDKWRLKYLEWKSYFIRISKKNHVQNCRKCANMYLYHFLVSLNNTFDYRNEASFLDKCKYNRYIIKNDIFQECLELADTSNENKLYIKILKSKSYILYFLFKTLVNMRKKLNFAGKV